VSVGGQMPAFLVHMFTEIRPAAADGQLPIDLLTRPVDSCAAWAHASTNT